MTMNRLRSAFPLAGAACTLVLLLAGCEDIVYKNRELFNPPKDTTSGFLGYFNVADKQTTCGNCHVTFQGQWIQTKHAHAAADLEGSGHAQSFCWGCHAVSELGNSVTVPAAYNAVADSAYRDVQCESCHGPGYQHVQSPSRENVPLASIKADTGLTTGCGECHTGEHNPFIEEWKESAHGSGPAFDYISTHVGTNPAYATCLPCHEGRQAIAVKFGDASNYVEKADAAKYQRIVCAVCHNPHGSANEHQLRAPVGSPTTDNLCVSCHSRAGTPVPPTTRGPHGAQGLLVIDQNVGWIPPGFAYDTLTMVGTHGTSANPRLCASCHVYTYNVTDKATGAFQLHVAGHTFEPIRCVDANGAPTGAESCPVDQRDFQACTTSGCHGTQTAARSAFLTVKARMEYLTDQLWNDVNANGIMDPYPTDTGLLPKIVANAKTKADSNQINLTDNTLTVAEGAIWNAELGATHDRPQWQSGKVFGRTFTSHYASGEGVHNPFLLEALLTASIQAVQSTYAVAPPQAIDLTVHAAPPPGLHTAQR